MGQSSLFSSTAGSDLLATVARKLHELGLKVPQRLFDETDEGMARRIVAIYPEVADDCVQQLSMQALEQPNHAAYPPHTAW